MWLFLFGLLATPPTEFAIAVAPGESLRVRREGLGRPVVLVPGLLGGAFSFRQLAALLRQRGYETIIIEPLGVGGSSRPPEADYSLTAQAKRVATVLESLEVGGVILVAHSLAASIALRVAAAHPSLISGIVSLEGGLSESAATPALRWAVRFGSILKLPGGREHAWGLLRQQIMESSGDRRWVTARVLEAYVTPVARDLDGTLKVYRAMVAARDETPTSAVLAAVRCPVVILLGGAPHAGGPEPAAISRLERALPHARSETLAGAGHFLQEERPDAVAIVVRELDARLTAQANTASTR